ncbi:hypothetical protein CVV38_02960 [Candidatus Peregrinibacteria bacterium HGW-Peregrinibacteria-1]|jgi:hypothetical protein|nr:MAG: hypothetical protein CVV38_02960 [Candidatus Peregrinibacteria bacterium HGW-Peregrinibacteria-1]
MNKRTIKTLAVTTLLATLIGVGYWTMTKNETESPPMLTPEKSAGNFQGMLDKDIGSYYFLGFDEDDREKFTALKGSRNDRPTPLNGGGVVHYAYSETDTNFAEIVSKINPSAEALVLAKYNSEDRKWHITDNNYYPASATTKYENTTEELAKVEIDAGTAFAIMTQSNTEIYDIRLANQKPEKPTSSRIQETCSTKTGWHQVLFSSHQELADSLQACQTRVISIWPETATGNSAKYTQHYSFDEINEDNYLSEQPLSTHLAWLNLRDAPQENTTTDSAYPDRNPAIQTSTQQQEIVTPDKSALQPSIEAPEATTPEPTTPEPNDQNSTIPPIDKSATNPSSSPIINKINQGTTTKSETINTRIVAPEGAAPTESTINPQTNTNFTNSPLDTVQPTSINIEAPEASTVWNLKFSFREGSQADADLQVTWDYKLASNLNDADIEWRLEESSFMPDRAYNRRVLPMGESCSTAGSNKECRLVYPHTASEYDIITSSTYHNLVLIMTNTATGHETYFTISEKPQLSIRYFTPICQLTDLTVGGTTYDNVLKIETIPPTSGSSIRQMKIITKTGSDLYATQNLSNAIGYLNRIEDGKHFLYLSGLSDKLDNLEAIQTNISTSSGETNIRMIKCQE